MNDGRRRRTLFIFGGALVLVLIMVAGVYALTSSSGDRLTVYSARSHYGEEQAFRDYAEKTGEDLTLFGGKATELYERIRNEREQTKADMLITVDAANLWRAKESGLLQNVSTPGLAADVPAELRDPDGAWFGLTVRARTIMRSTERVQPEDVTTYEGLGDPRFKGRLCLRSGTSEYNVSFIADRLAKDGEEKTRAMLERWMANDPQILGSDVDVLEAIAAGRCDVGLTNTYYLGRELADNPGFPVAPVYADQKGRGTHVNLSGIGIVRWAKHRAQAVRLLEFLTQPEQQARLARANHELAATPGVEPTKEIAQFGDFKRDPIDVAAAGAKLDEALKLMGSVGWN